MNDDETRAREKMTAFAQTFPSIWDASGVEPWDPSELEIWGNGPRSHGERVSAQFLLTVWDPSTDWSCGHFDLMEALPVWDPEHHKAFMRWAANPWWP